MGSIARLASAWVVATCVSGCGTGWFHVGNDFDTNAFTTRVERGATTRDQVRSWLGSPASTGVNVETTGQRYEEWTYYFAEGRMSSLAGTTLKTLQVKFDTNGVVQGWDVSAPPK